ncbi:DUF4224 domain-containing protein [Burkholderia gladioli]|uniref:DUF4224 domain-containing protein n=1 Tax=Burkholderia gladioli TaxID=28095 RepID=UPI0016416D22
MKIRTSIKTGNPTSWQGLVVRSSLNFYKLQVAWLRTSGIPFWTNARGRPIIARAFFTGQKTEVPPRPKWQPKVLL